MLISKHLAGVDVSPYYYDFYFFITYLDILLIIFQTLFLMKDMVGFVKQEQDRLY